MNVAVCMKQTFDTEAKIVLDAGGAIESQGVNLIINPYDEYALEEALRITEASGGEVTVVSVGGPQVRESLRQALAMGVDRAVLVDPEMEELDESGTALILAAVISTLGCDVVLGGLRSVDTASSQVMGRLSEALGLPVVGAVTGLECGQGMAVATHDVEGGSEVVELALPAVFTAQKDLNEPRYPSMKGILHAKKKPLQELGLSDLGLDPTQLEPKVETLSLSLPAPRNAGRTIAGEPAEAARELARLLRDEAKVL